MATAKKLPSGSYRVRVYDKNTGKYKSFTAETKKAAELAAAEWLIKCQGEENQQITFQTAAEEYIKIKTPVLSPTTIHGYQTILRNNVDRLKDIPIDKVTPQLVQDWVNGLTVDKSPKTVHNIYGFFTAVMSYYDVDIRLGKIRLPSKTKKFKILPDVETVVDLFRGSDIEIPVLLAVWGGMRMSEILGIRRKDLCGDVLTLSQVRVTVGKEIIDKEQAKTYNSRRQLRLGQPIVNLIDSLNLQPDDYVVTYTRKQVYGRFVKAMRSAGYQITFHDLRHINASVMAKLNVPDVYAMERGGWSNTSTLKSVYQQTFDTDRQRIDQTIDNYFQDIYDTKCDMKNIKQRKNVV